jgi:hypothetical protein
MCRAYVIGTGYYLVRNADSREKLQGKTILVLKYEGFTVMIHAWSFSDYDAMNSDGWVFTHTISQFPFHCLYSYIGC